MVKKIIEFSAKNRFLVIFLTAALLVIAWQCLNRIKLDAIPDLSDTQVIIYSRWDRSPDIIEDQVTYPIVSGLLGAPRVKDIRAFSDFGFSYVYVIFEDGTDIYWARSRVMEYLGKITSRLPQGVKTELGPDATGVGWVYQYALVDTSGRYDSSELRTLQDWFLRYELQSVPGVAEVASLGGFEKQYQVQVDPRKLAFYGITLMDVGQSIRKANSDAGGRLIEIAGFEYMVRSRGYAKSIGDLENIVVRYDEKSGPIYLKNISNVSLGPNIRRGVSDLDGEGDVVGGIVVMRFGENAYRVIERVKQRLEEIKPSLPPGVRLVETYDRSDLIRRAMDTLKHQLVEEVAIVSLMILLFLWHIPSAIVPIITIPIAILLSFIPLYLTGTTSNIMSLAGIAISIGVLVDGAIVEVENAYKKLEKWREAGSVGDFHEVRLSALKEVGPSVFFSLLLIAVAFIPIFSLVDQEGRLFKPLAFSKNYTMLIAAILAVTLDPAVRMLFSRAKDFSFKPKFACNVANAVLVGKYYPEEKHPVSRVLFALYEPVCRFVLKFPKAVLGIACLLFLSVIPVFMHLGSEFMPTLHEGVILYMPTTMPGISVGEAQKLLIAQDKIIKSFPEVERVYGKAGRAETSTDPAPLSMFETTVTLKPESRWRPGMTYEKLVDEMDAALKFPGVTNAWTMPIKNRIDMLSTGMRTPVGVKIYGADLAEIERIGKEAESLLKGIRGTRSVYAERAAAGYFVDFILDRQALAQYGLSVEDANNVIMTALGGEEVTTTIEGRQRFSINVRYEREFREDVDAIRRALVSTPNGSQIPIERIAQIRLAQGPSMIRDENGRLCGYVYVDMSGRDIGSYVQEARKILSDRLKLPVGYTLAFSGQYENMIRVKERLKLVIPLTLFLIILLLYLNTRSWFKTFLVMLAVPFSLIGAVWLLHFLGYNLSIAVWVGMIALMGLDAETGVFMLLYLDLAYHDRVKQNKMKTYEDLKEAVVEGAVRRVRPKMMTVMAAMFGLLPILWSHGTGSDMMKRIAAPMVGGLVTSFILELVVYPAAYTLWKWNGEMKNRKTL